MAVDRELTKEAKLENLPLLRKFIESGCGAADLDVGLTYDLVLAVDEVCTNIITHGYKYMDPGSLTVNFKADDEKVTIVISDKGRPFHPEDAPSPDIDADWKERQVGGLGLFLLRQVADEVSYNTDKDKVNHLTVVKQLTAEKEEGQKPQKDKDSKESEPEKDPSKTKAEKETRKTEKRESEKSEEKES